MVNIYPQKGNVLHAEFLPDWVWSNNLEEKALNFKFDGVIITGLQISLAGFLFWEMVLSPASLIKLNFILPNNVCLIACMGKSVKKEACGFIQYQNQQQVSVATPLCINLLCCTFPYGDAFIAPNIDAPNLELIQNAFADILHCKQTGISKSLFLKAKFYEVLSMIGNMATGNEPLAAGFGPRAEGFGLRVAGNGLRAEGFGEPALSTEDVEKIKQAKAIIEATLQNPCSLIALAHKVGLNDFKLKKHFKEMYGNTVFGYLYHVRMEKACILLKQKQKISDVAYTVGYKNAQHFTAAFKKRFGVVPSAFLKVKNV